MSATELFIWNTSFDTGLSTIDRQHHRLVEMINDAVRLSFEGAEMKQAAVLALRKSLGEYVKRHFSTEERIMERYAVDKRHRDFHEAEHRGFTAKEGTLFFDAERMDSETLGGIAEYLIRWLAYHILNTDKVLARQILLIRGGAAPEAAFDEQTFSEDEQTEPLLKALRTLFYMVSEKNAELERINRELEDKVRARAEELEKANRKLSQQAMEDELTGLPNRRYAMAMLERQLLEWSRYEKPFSVLLIDADRFKGVNDTYGHEFGDKVLLWIANFLRDNTRKSDMVCRIGGDEFLVICPHTARSEANLLGRQLSAKAKAVNEREPLEYWKVSLSIGTASPAARSKSIKGLLTKADESMYAAKQAGGGQLDPRLLALLIN